MSTSEERLHRLYTRIARDLSYRFDGVFTLETVVAVVQAARTELEGRSRIADFVPVLVEKAARDELQAGARRPDHLPAGLVDLLFVCPERGGRAQIAATLAEQCAGSRACVRTAGADPTELVVRAADVVVTLGTGIICPVVPGKWYQDWDVLNPDGQDEATVAAIRTELQRRVSSLVTSLGL